MEVCLDDDLIIGDLFTMAFGAPPPQHDSTVPFNRTQQHLTGDAPTQLETTQEAATADQHAATLDAINRRAANPFVPQWSGARATWEHLEAPPQAKAKSAPPAQLRIDDEIWQQATQMKDVVRESLPPLRAGSQELAGARGPLPPPASAAEMNEAAAVRHGEALPPIAHGALYERAEAKAGESQRPIAQRGPQERADVSPSHHGHAPPEAKGPFPAP